MTVAKPHSFGRYRVTKPLGAGAMGEVYEAVDDLLGREVAIKTLRSAHGVTARFIDDRFRNEARAIAQFSHPGVVQVFDIDLAAEPPYLVMERVTGPALSERLTAGPLAADELVPLGIQIARALAAAHVAGVVHRDIKPANILGAGPGTWKLADFGVAHVPDSSLTMTGQFVGSPAYAAPESLVKGVSSAAGDVYSLGATLYQAAAGRWPRLDANAALLATVPPVRTLAPELPAHVATAIDRAVALEADRRPSANELADLLAGVAPVSALAGVAPVSAPASRPPSPQVSTPAHTSAPAPSASSTQLARWKPWAIAGAIALLVIVVLALRGEDSRTGTHASPLPSVSAEPAAQPRELPPIGQIQILPPRNLAGKAARDWEKVVDRVYKSRLDAALRELDKFEHKHGATEETQYLRAQLERLPPELLEHD